MTLRTEREAAERGVFVWTRDHPWAVDLAVAGVAAVSSFASVFYVAGLVGWPVALGLHIVPPIVLLLRRRSAVGVMGVLVALDAAQWVLEVPFSGAQIATLVALYTLARQVSVRASLTGLGIVMLLIAVAPLRQPFADAVSVVFALATVVLVHVLGRNVELRAVYLTALEDRARRLERDRDAAVAAAAHDERARIARELHDVVAHHVSVMVVQAEGASWALAPGADETDSARTAVTTIADTGRSALRELRLLLGVLRDEPAGVEPQPGLAELPTLVDRFRDSGLCVRLDVTPQSRLSESLELTVFRIAQEGLTNVLKHAGPGAVAAVTVELAGDAVTVSVIDDGCGSPARSSDLRGGSVGHGLTGIGERVAMFGGTVTSGPRPGGGYTVSALIPHESQP